jgi:hypothetical protein
MADINSLLQRVYFRDKKGQMGYKNITTPVLRYNFPFECTKIQIDGAGGIAQVTPDTTILLQPNTIVKGYDAIFDIDDSYDNVTVDQNNVTIDVPNEEGFKISCPPSGSEVFGLKVVIDGKIGVCAGFTQPLNEPYIVSGGSLISESVEVDVKESFRPSDYGGRVLSVEFNYYNPSAVENFCNYRRFSNDNRCIYYDGDGNLISLKNDGNSISGPAPGTDLPLGNIYNENDSFEQPTITPAFLLVIIVVILFILFMLLIVGLYSFGKLSPKKRIKTVDEFQIDEIKKDSDI